MNKKFCLIVSITILFFLAGDKSTYAQDPHFSQYFLSPMTVNPAFAGRHVEDWKIAALFQVAMVGKLFRTFYTTTLSIEKRLLASKTDKNILAAGGYLLTDASNGGVLKNTFISLNLAYHISLDAEGKSVLGLGMAAAYANRFVDAGKFQFQSQFGSMGFQRTMPSGDPVAVLNNKYMDVNAGVYYSNETSKSISYNAGVSIYHASKPAQGYYNNTSYSLDPRISIQAGMQFALQNKDQLDISGVSDIQGQNKIFTAGAVYKLKLVNDETFSGIDFGLWNRFSDAVYPYIGIEGKGWHAGLSYDIITSNVKDNYSSLQSMEFSLVWLLGSKKNHPSYDGSIIKY